MTEITAKDQTLSLPLLLSLSLSPLLSFSLQHNGICPIPVAKPYIIQSKQTNKYHHIIIHYNQSLLHGQPY